MLISAIQITNYKTYKSTSTLRLEAGINIITGQNNSGKTSLLEALRLAISSTPHRSRATIPRPETQPEPYSKVRAQFSINREEFNDFSANFNDFNLIMPPLGTRYGNLTFNKPDPAEAAKLFELIRSNEIHKFIATIPSGGPTIVDYSSYYHEVAKTESGLYNYATLHVGPDRTIAVKSRHQAQHSADLVTHIVAQFRERIYLFQAERFNRGICAVGANDVLKPNAENLAEVLANLQSNKSRFERFNEAVRRVLPQVHHVSVRNIDHNQVRIFIWNDDPKYEREDLAAPLDSCGTGVGQVLAILYVVLNSNHPRIILIDEPQSFLHPGAVRKLIEILKEHPQHQYVLATHSPTVISAANASTITLITRHEGVSDFQTVDPTENEQLRQYLTEIGARLSDLFGADDVLWVEGPTEEICFPIILEKVARHPLMGTSIMAVKHTGDLEGRHAKTVFEIYGRLSKGQGLLPPAVGFIFDKEGRTEQEREDIRKQSHDTVLFTPRRLYENYLLNPKAIAAVISTIEGFRDPPVTETDVRQWIDGEVKQWLAGERTNRKYGPVPTDANQPWQSTIHGAKLLEHLFKDLSELRFPYDKITHSVALTKWIAENAPEDLRELADLIKQLLSSSPSRRAPSAAT